MIIDLKKCFKKESFFIIYSSNKQLRLAYEAIYTRDAFFDILEL